MEATTREPTEIKLVTREDQMRVPFHKLEVGGRFVSRARTITETDVVNFAALTADWHPLHTNAEHAKESIFGQRVAHGMLLLSYSIGLVPNEYVVALRRLKNVTFKKPVFFGDTIRVRRTIGTKTEHKNPAQGFVIYEVEVLNQDDKVVQKGQWNMLVRRREGSAG